MGSIIVSNVDEFDLELIGYQQQQGNYGGGQFQNSGGQYGAGGGQQDYNQQQQYYQQGQQNQQTYNQYNSAPPAPAPAVEQIAYVPPVRSIPSPASSTPFSRAQVDPSAPPPTKAPTMSLKIGGAAAAPAASVSLKIGGGTPAAVKVPVVKSLPSTSTTPASSKAPTPASSKPGTPVGERVSTPVSTSTKESKATKAATKEETVTTTESLLAEVKASADDETLADLYGQDDEGKIILSFV